MNKVIAKLPKVHLFTKRQKIITTAVILSLGLLYTQLVPIYLINKFIVALSGLSYLLSLWALWEGISERGSSKSRILLKAVILLILPTLFTLAVASYYFLLPVRWLTRLPVAVAFGLAYYCLLLSQNVFNVSAMRTIPLYRAASTVAFTFTLITAFLLFNVIFSFEMIFFANGLAIFLLSLPLILQVLWSLEMDRLSTSLMLSAIILSLVLSEIGLSLSFWPISGPMGSLILATALYVILGVITHNLKDRLSRGVTLEYLGVGGIVFLVALLTTSWTG